ADLMHAILGGEPDWRRLPAATPARVREVLAWCLRRDPAERLKDAGDLRILLGGTDVTAAAPAAPAGAARGPRSRLAVLGWTAAVVLAAGIAWTRAHPAVAPPARPLHV